jgi:hypothetical protein
MLKTSSGCVLASSNASTYGVLYASALSLAAALPELLLSIQQQGQ